MCSVPSRWSTFVVLAAVVSLGSYWLGHQMTSSEAKATQQASVLDRVKNSKKLRCAYWLWPELIERNPNTGAMSGVFVDLIDKVGEALNAQVLWESEATMDDFVTLVDSGKVDAICGPLIPAAFLRPSAKFAAPVLYASFDVYVRSSEARFNDSRESLNAPGATILSLDGSAARYFATTVFPAAHQNSLPAVLGAGQVLLDVKDGKADATVSEQLTAGRFLDHNPGSLRQLRWANQPLVTLGVTPFVTKTDDVVWSSTLNAIIQDLLDFGVVEQVFSKHALIAGKHYQPIVRPYQQ